MTHYCKNNNCASSSFCEPFKDDVCDDCWEGKNINAWICRDGENTPSKRPVAPNIEMVLGDVLAHGHDVLLTTGIYKAHGWAFDYRPVLTLYLVKTDTSIEERYSLNKDILYSIYEQCEYIIKAPNQ